MILSAGIHLCWFKRTVHHSYEFNHFRADFFFIKIFSFYAYGLQRCARFHCSKTASESTAIRHSVSRASQQCMIVHTLFNFDRFLTVFFVHTPIFLWSLSLFVSIDWYMPCENVIFSNTLLLFVISCWVWYHTLTIKKHWSCRFLILHANIYLDFFTESALFLLQKWRIFLHHRRQYCIAGACLEVKTRLRLLANKERERCSRFCGTEGN